MKWGCVFARIDVLLKQEARFNAPNACSAHARASGAAGSECTHFRLSIMFCSRAKMYVCVRVCHVAVPRLSCDPGPHVQSIRANQKAVIRAWHGGGAGEVAPGEF